MAHAGHQRAFDDVQRALRRKSRLLGVSIDEFGNAMDKSVGKAILDRSFTPGQVFFHPGKLGPAPDLLGLF